MPNPMRALGCILAGLTVVYAIYLTLVARYRVRATVDRGVVMKILQYELLICAGLLILSLDLGFGLGRLLRLAPIAWALRLAALLLILPVLALSTSVLIHMNDRPAAPTDTAIVLGMALEHGRPNRDLLRRVEAAADYASVHPDARLIVTGGNAGGGLSEAGVMRGLLAERGVDIARIMTEDQAVDTDENFANVARMIDPAQPVTLITSGYHMLRASAIAGRAGFTSVQRLSARCDPRFLPANVAWEVVCEIDRRIKQMH